MSDAIAIHEAFKRGDLEALRTLLGNPPDFPNGRGPRGVGEIILEYAITGALWHLSALSSNWAPIPITRTMRDFLR